MKVKIVLFILITCILSICHVVLTSGQSELSNEIALKQLENKPRTEMRSYEQLKNNTYLLFDMLIPVTFVLIFGTDIKKAIKNVEI